MHQYLTYIVKILFIYLCKLNIPMEAAPISNITSTQKPPHVFQSLPIPKVKVPTILISNSIY